MPGVLVVQHQPSVLPGSIVEVLSEEQLDHRILQAWEVSEWPTVEDFDGLIVMGGTMNVDQLDEFPFLRQARDLMSSSVSKGIPTLGVCLGSQMMARVLDAPVRRASPRNAFFSPLDLTDDGRKDDLLSLFSDGLPVLQFHEDTFEMPIGATPLATSARSNTAQAFRFGDTAYAIQFHFEVDENILRGWCKDIGEPGMTEEWGVPTDRLVEEAGRAIPRQWEAGKELTRRFLQLLK